jgi:5-methylcytosine-specific restriction endonuclease McrA
MDCSHQNTTVTARLQSNGTKAYWRQCLDCGQSVGTAIARAKINCQVIPWDEELCQRGRKELWHAAALNREQQNAEWWERYHAHLDSHEWQVLRRKVFRRCNGICEGCGEQPATQVHHLSYDRMGHEMLFDLVGICEKCHKSIPNKFNRIVATTAD